MPNSGDVEWSAFDDAAQASLRRLAEITLACLTVLALLIGLNLKKAAPNEARSDDAGTAEVPQITPELEGLPKNENNFID